MSASANVDHLPTAFDPSTCVRRGLCPVTSILNEGPEVFESHSLYYEQHGSGTDYKVVFIMGLNSSSFAWGPQVLHFGRSEEHSILVFDNRGVGNSGYPRGPYTTAGMAEDAIALLDYIGWTEKRDLHVVGISLGGMIAQELASRIPDRIASLVLAVTTPGGRPWNNFPPWTGVVALAKLTFTLDPVKKAAIATEMLYPAPWLNEKAEDDPQGRTNRQVQKEMFLRRVDVTPPQALLGVFSQMAAGLTHHCKPDRLRRISGSIPKVLIVTGDEDNLVRPEHSFEIKAAMPEAELIQWECTGHGIHYQRVKQFNALLEKTFREGKEAVRKEAARKED
ncbi:putative aminoacrylate hydrolase RutD [Hypsizygus marmoreus]|uniref:Aminoacrylate hydrolase RutD n=1 Tax=Hypsizygus marmoreus TaxID=39966 RepID=A0A369J3B5_HYPMA|nr:putative aminoacrylate hydrolase RutD [Hypsizygus marmoreus]